MNHNYDKLTDWIRKEYDRIKKEDIIKFIQWMDKNTDYRIIDFYAHELELSQPKDIEIMIDEYLKSNI